MFVMDEVDEMLSRGFQEQIQNIFLAMPQNIQVWLEDFLCSGRSFLFSLDHSSIGYYVQRDTRHDNSIDEWSNQNSSEKKWIYVRRHATILCERRKWSMYVQLESSKWIPRKFFYVQHHKLDTLCDLYVNMPIMQAVVFCHTRRKVAFLTEEMRSRNFIVSSMVSFSAWYFDKNSDFANDWRLSTKKTLNFMSNDRVHQSSNLVFVSI